MTTKMPVRYYGLQLISGFYKALSVLTVLVVVGGLGYVSIEAVTSREADYGDFQWWLPRALLLVIGGGMLALLFYVISQVIDVQLSMNEKLSQIAKTLQDNPNALKTYEAMGQKLSDEMEKIRVIVQTQSRMNRVDFPVETKTP